MSLSEQREWAGEDRTWQCAHPHNLYMLKSWVLRSLSKHLPIRIYGSVQNEVLRCVSGHPAEWSAFAYLCSRKAMIVVSNRHDAYQGTTIGCF